jgi:NAD-dependent deacetylase
VTLDSLLKEWQRGAGRLVFLTGAGVSAESGIPTFRGKGGFWTAGSKHYSPMDLATRATFVREPETVWLWYLARFAACSSAEPNAAHRAIFDLQSAYGDRVALITQNVDGLHQRAGSPADRTYAIHGDARFIRCSHACGLGVAALPAIGAEETRDGFSERLRSRLTCAGCGGWMRPHVLWFDEYYDEEHYRAESALAAARSATLVIVVGTTGATTLPMTIGLECQRRGAAVIDVNIEDTPFSDIAALNGCVVRDPATVAIPHIAALLGPAPRSR